jgi:hypothetical protein
MTPNFSNSEQLIKIFSLFSFILTLSNSEHKKIFLLFIYLFNKGFKFRKRLNVEKIFVFGIKKGAQCPLF